ncbi:hypothetical protein [Pimelobacter sp. 30-1]|uniref:hypothetical protein n=1 Tax=Pimelobacter sp. 30-1 TaxID=2004991 RepID=UPI001C051857|nr:hypothetical protein [Pimelobacter sp. 30-1]MBU2698568.1 hypothetical protein [Pimelobacter sp. 30-1]
MTESSRQDATRAAERDHQLRLVRIIAWGTVPLGIAVAPVALLTDVSAGAMAAVVLGVLAAVFAFALQRGLVRRSRDTVLLLVLVGMALGLALVAALAGY